MLLLYSARCNLRVVFCCILFISGMMELINYPSLQQYLFLYIVRSKIIIVKYHIISYHIIAVVKISTVNIILLFLRKEPNCAPSRIINYSLKEFLQLIRKERGEVAKRLPPTTFCLCFSRRCAR